MVGGDLPAELANDLRRAGGVAVDKETSGLDWATNQLQLFRNHAIERIAPKEHLEQLQALVRSDRPRRC